MANASATTEKTHLEKDIATLVTLRLTLQGQERELERQRDTLSRQGTEKRNEIRDNATQLKVLLAKLKLDDA